MKKCEIKSFDPRWFGASENSKCGFGVQSLSLILGLARRLVNNVLQVDVLSELVTQNLLVESEQEAIVDREIRRIYTLVQGSCQR